MPTAGTLQICQLLQRRILDRIFQLDDLIMALENQLVDAWACWMEDMALQNIWRAEDVTNKDLWYWCEEGLGGPRVLGTHPGPGA